MLAYTEINPPPFERPVLPRRFKLEDWNDISFSFENEWRVKHVLPLRGVALLYGKSQGFKSFVALHLMLSIARGVAWAGKRVERGKVVYIAAEGAAGLRKRIRGCQMKGVDVPPGQFALISDSPNLGTDRSELPDLIRAIDNTGIKPAVIVIDTAAKAIGTAEENGAGMAALIINSEALARRFGCLVLVVHHVGHGEDAQDRPRGWSGLTGALDAQLLCKRDGEGMMTTLKLQKEKDEESNVTFSARLSRVILGHDRDGDEVSTLVVEEVVQAAKEVVAPKAKSVPKSQWLLMDAVANALEEKGIADFLPYGSTGPKVRAVADIHIRERYFARIAEKAAPDEDEQALYERQRKAFNRSIKAAIDAKTLVAADHKGERFIWGA